jgi:23S rRNA (pseudouridine1915-N3)-methyltransferase
MIKIICVGKIKEQYLIKLIEDYKHRINKYHKLEIIEIPDSNPIEEGKKIIPKLTNGLSVALSIKGKKHISEEFSELIDQTLMNKANINFIIGGSDGLSNEVLEICDMQVSFGDLTFPHGLFRGILLEQIYRSFKIIKGEKYHK